MSQRIGWTDLRRRGKHHSRICITWAFGHGVMGSVPGEIESEVESSECQVVSQKQTKKRRRHSCFPLIIFLVSIYLTNGFIRNLNAIPCFRDVVLYCFLQLSLNELKSLCG